MRLFLLFVCIIEAIAFSEMVNAQPTPEETSQYCEKCQEVWVDCNLLNECTDQKYKLNNLCEKYVRSNCPDTPKFLCEKCKEVWIDCFQNENCNTDQKLRPFNFCKTFLRNACPSSQVLFCEQCETFIKSCSDKICDQVKSNQCLSELASNCRKSTKGLICQMMRNLGIFALSEAVCKRMGKPLYVQLCSVALTLYGAYVSYDELCP